MTLKITRIILFVNEVIKVAEFYRDILGLKVIGKLNPEWTELKAGECNIALHKASASFSGEKETSVKIVFGTKDVAKAKALIEEKGIKMSKIISFDARLHGQGINFCDGSDPEGNKFQFSDR